MKIILLIRNAILLISQFKKPNWNKLIIDIPFIDIPWGSLIALLLINVFLGYIFTRYNAPFWVWAVAGAWVGTVSVHEAAPFVVAMAVTVAITRMANSNPVQAIIELVFGAYMAGLGAWIVSWVGAEGMKWAVTELENSLNKFHTFLILVATSNVGLGLGWIVYRLFNPV